jgi:dinuclear metal center YbgI/SA1388 family protein
MKLRELLPALDSIAPLETAEEWDNVGLLVGNTDREVDRVMTCLTLTDTTLEEAISEKAELIVCHHPIPFKAMSQITSATSSGALLLRAIEAKIAIYSPHTAWDNAAFGINQQLAEMLQLQSIRPLKKFPAEVVSEENTGVGRCGYLPTGLATIRDILNQLKIAIPQITPRHTHDSSRTVKKLGIVCGSGGSMLGLVASRNCDAMLTGEATYHQCLESESRGIALIMIGHHASEAFSMGSFATILAERLNGLTIFASSKEASKF